MSEGERWGASWRVRKPVPEPISRIVRGEGDGEGEGGKRRQGGSNEASEEVEGDSG